MELRMEGEDRERGFTLAELRQFARDTEDWPGDTWLDCLIPGKNPEKPQMAALMGLYAAENTNCPRCAAPLRGEPVMHPLSRVDNRTRICNDCGNAEAVFNHFWPDQPIPPLTEKIQPFTPDTMPPPSGVRVVSPQEYLDMRAREAGR
jgi:hypothetical protein